MHEMYDETDPIDPIDTNTNEHKTLIKILTYLKCPECNHDKVKWILNETMEVPNADMYSCICPKCKNTFSIFKILRNTNEFEQCYKIAPYHLVHSLQLIYNSYDLDCAEGNELIQLDDYHTLFFKEIAVEFELSLLQILSLAKHYKE